MNKFLLGGAALTLAASASAQWEQKSPTTSAPPLGYHAQCFDLVNGRTIAFGGDTLGGPFGAVSDQTWSYDGSTWTNVSPATGPSGRTLCEMVYDINRGVSVLYGGVPLYFFGGGPALDETWEWDGTNWTQVFPTNSPGGLANYGMAYDWNRGRTVLYGGQQDTFFVLDSDQTWEFDGLTWTQVTPATNPGPLERTQMCYHAGLQRTVLFGGFDVQGSWNDDVWLWDGSNWTIAPITGPRPPYLSGAAMEYDSFNETIIVAGGYDVSQGGFNAETNQTWILDLSTNTWSQDVASFTTARSGARVSFDANRRQMVMFGGFSSATFSQLAETWEFGARVESFGSGCAGTNGVPTATATDAPRFGAPYTVDVTGLNTTINIGVMALSNAEIDPALDLGVVLGMTGCSAYVPADILDTVVGAGGIGTWGTVIPANTAFLGGTIVGQLYSFDPGVNSFGFVNSNATIGTVGY